MNNLSTTPSHRQRGLSLVELMISLAISAVLLVATMVALDVSFRAYADAAEQASSQAATRMVTNRLLTMIRTSTAHGPLLPNPLANPPVTLNGNIITSSFIQVLTPDNNIVQINYLPATQQLSLTTTPAGGGVAQTQPLLDGVTAAQFFAVRRLNDQGVLVLDRATMDITVVPGAAATLSLENGTAAPIRVIASTKPRKIP